MNTQINNKNGQVSAYGFMCGYIQRLESANLDKELFKDCYYHVRSTKHNSAHLNTIFGGDGKPMHKFSIWETFESLTEARKFYNSIK